MPALRPAPALPAALASLALVLSGCSAAGGASASGSAPGAAASASGAPVAVATTTQLGSVLQEVAACRGARTGTVMGPGDDPHEVAPSARQMAAMERAGLVFANGLGLEGGMATALEGARRDGARVVEVAPQLDPLPFGAEHAGEDAAEHAAHEHHEHGSQDPHVWMDVARMARAAVLMGDELAARTGDDGYRECGRQVQGRLQETDRQVREILAAVPEGRRTVVTDHDAYGYLGAAYGLHVAGVVIPGGSTDAAPSSSELAALTASVRDSGAAALVTSVGAAGGLVQTVARESGGLPVVELYEGGVGPVGTPEKSYAGAMLHNARVLADALAG